MNTHSGFFFFIKIKMFYIHFTYYYLLLKYLRKIIWFATLKINHPICSLFLSNTKK